MKLPPYIFLFLILVPPLFGQDSTTVIDTSTTAITIYKDLYNTASRDKAINADEKAMLNTLRRSLKLSKFQIFELEKRLNHLNANRLDQSGRWPVVLQNIGWGAGLYGWGIPYLLSLDDTKWFAASQLMSLAGSFYLTYKFTEKMNIPHSRAQMMRLGSGIGFHYGWAITKAARIESGFDANNKTWLGLLMSSVPIGIFAGDKLYHYWQPTNGQAWAISLSSVMGSVIASNLHQLINRKPKENDYVVGRFPNSHESQETNADIEKWEQIDGFLTIAAYPVSLYLGNKIFGEKDYTFGDALILSQGYGAGIISTLMLLDMLKSGNLDKDDSLFKIGIIGGGIVGTFLYDRTFLQEKDYSFGQSILLAAGTLSGLTFGAGIGVMTEVDFSTTEGLMLAGGILGTVVTNNILAPEQTGHHARQNFSAALIPGFNFMKGNNKIEFLPSINLQLSF